MTKIVTNVVSATKEIVTPTFEEVCKKAKKDGINAYKLFTMQLLDCSPTFAESSDKERYETLSNEISELEMKLASAKENLKPLANKGYLQSFDNIAHQVVTYYPQNSGDNVQLAKVENIINYYRRFNKLTNVTDGKDLVKIAENTLIGYSKIAAHRETRQAIAKLFDFAVSFGAPKTFATYRKCYEKFCKEGVK